MHTNYAKSSTIPAARHYQSHKSPILVFNVGQWADGKEQFVRPLVGCGTYVVPIRKDGEPVSAPCIIPDPVIEEFSISLGSQNKTETWEGERIAQEVIMQSTGDDLHPGVGAGKRPENDLRRWGLFISKTAKGHYEGSKFVLDAQPAQKEIDAATEAYLKTLGQLVEDADQLFAAGPKEWSEARRPAHYFAAEKLGIKRPWNQQAQQMAAKATKQCISCAEDILEEAKKCKHCGELQNQKGARQ